MNIKNIKNDDDVKDLIMKYMLEEATSLFMSKVISHMVNMGWTVRSQSLEKEMNVVFDAEVVIGDKTYALSARLKGNIRSPSLVYKVLKYFNSYKIAMFEDFIVAPERVAAEADKIEDEKRKREEKYLLQCLERALKLVIENDNKPGYYEISIGVNGGEYIHGSEIDEISAYKNTASWTDSVSRVDLHILEGGSGAIQEVEIYRDPRRNTKKVMVTWSCVDELKEKIKVLTKKMEMNP